MRISDWSSDVCSSDLKHTGHGRNLEHRLRHLDRSVRLRRPSDPRAGDPPMIRLSVLYPKTEGAAFDHDYYRDNHVPLACRTWGLDPAAAQIAKGVAAPYAAAVPFHFDSLTATAAASGGEGTGEVLADVANSNTTHPTS